MDDDVIRIEDKKAKANLESKKEFDERYNALNSMDIRHVMGIRDIAKGASNLVLLGLESNITSDDRRHICEVLEYDRRCKSWDSIVRIASSMKILGIDVELSEYEKNKIHDIISKKLVIDILHFIGTAQAAKQLGIPMDISERTIASIQKRREINAGEVVPTLGQIKSSLLMLYILGEKPPEDEKKRAYEFIEKIKQKNHFAELVSLAAIMRMVGLEITLTDSEKDSIKEDMLKEFRKYRDISSYDSRLRLLKKVIDIDNKRWFGNTRQK